MCIGIIAIELQRLVQVLQRLVGFSALKKVDADKSQGHMIIRLMPECALVVFHGGINIVLIACQNVARHNERPFIFRIPAQGIDHAIDGIILIILL